ncbi:hypothetical protein [Pseudokineococcus sp. 1T1Z-3]|uniref:hypothetical protein n=1 Tax=Pseudokineococcus sp. 1T1Z-3 TaxID=3132745 RepID=UPI0030970FAF
MRQTPMRHTDEEIDAAAHRFERLADELDPETALAVDTADLQRVASATRSVRTEEMRLREAVAEGQVHGRSWAQIGLALGVSRQAARQRFSDRASA